jgi:phosphoenolpyruvate carboxylase
LSLGSWIRPGDLDGYPATGPDTVEEALDRARSLVLERYRFELCARWLAASGLSVEAR